MEAEKQGVPVTGIGLLIGIAPSEGVAGKVLQVLQVIVPAVSLALELEFVLFCITAHYLTLLKQTTCYKTPTNYF